MSPSSYQVVLGHQVDDIEISNRIYVQYCEIKDAIFPRLPDEGEMFAVLLDLMKKLETTRYHRDNLIRIARDVSSTVPESVARDARQVLVQDFTSGIEKEFEAFLMQGKASLDILVKIFKPLFGVNLPTFGDAGKKVKNAIRRNLPTTNPERTSRLENLIIQHEDWIGKWFTQERTTVSHYRALVHSGVFYGPQEGGGAKTISLPRTKDGVLIHEVAASTYEKLLDFCEDFVSYAASIKFPPVIDLMPAPPQKQEDSHPRKYCLRFDEGRSSLPVTR
jgi:hypothetical protein